MPATDQEHELGLTEVSRWRILLHSWAEISGKADKVLQTGFPTMHWAGSITIKWISTSVLSMVWTAGNAGCASDWWASDWRMMIWHGLTDFPPITAWELHVNSKTSPTAHAHLFGGSTKHALSWTGSITAIEKNTQAFTCLKTINNVHKAPSQTMISDGWKKGMVSAGFLWLRDSQVNEMWFILFSDGHWRHMRDGKPTDDLQ